MMTDAQARAWRQRKKEEFLAHGDRRENEAIWNRCMKLADESEERLAAKYDRP